MDVYAPLQKLKFSHQLLIMMVIAPSLVGLLLVYWVAGYAMAHAADAWVAITAVCLFVLLLYAASAVLFIKRMTAKIMANREALVNLSMGKSGQVLAMSGNDEIAEMALAVNRLTEDLTHKAEFTEQIRAGNLHAAEASFNQHDRLGHALVKMKESLATIQIEDQQRNWATEGLAKFVEILRSNKNVKELSQDITKTLAQLLQANQGALFILNNEPSGEAFLEMQACYAYQRTKYLTQKVALGEGLVGQAFLEKETIYLQEIPNDFVRITSGLGQANPKNILITPLKMNEEMVGVVELASFREFAKHEIAFVEKISENIAHTITSLRLAENTRTLLQESQAQAENMRAQEEELRQNQEELQATQEEISRKYQELFRQITALNYQSKFDQLKSITSTKKRNVEYYFDIIRNQILTFSENKMVIEAVKDFRSAFYKIGEGLSMEQQRSMKDHLTRYYVDEFIPRLNDDADEQVPADGYVPEDTHATLLQYLYISNNPHPTGQKSLLDDASDGSDYSKAHAVYHPVIRSFLEKFGYYDIFLIEPQTGDMVYSVFKEVDFATSLVSGLYHPTNFGRVVKEAIASDDRHFVKLIDFEPYDPSYRAPASFIACPVYDNDCKIGILVFQMPINKINQILTGNNKWKEDGLGESGETFIVGDDYKFRSISRELIENEQYYLSALEREGYTDRVIHQIKKAGTNILLEEVKLDSVSKALQGATGTEIEKNNRGVNTLNAFAPLAIPDVHWIIMSTMKEEEASMRINSLRDSH